MSLKILMIIPSLPTGGAEWAFVRMANALAVRHEVTVYVPYVCSSSPALWSALSAGIRRVSLPLPHRWFQSLIYKLTLLWPTLGLEKMIHRRVLMRLYHTHHFSVVNPHLMSGTQLACDAFHDQALRIVETDHGDYAIRKKQDAAMHDHRLIFSRLDGIACPSLANADYMREFPWKYGFTIAVIPYASSLPPRSNSRVNASPFTFGMVSRGIAEKGWAEALAAFRQIQKMATRPVQLLFVGDGAEIERLRGEVSPSDESVVFAGHQSDTAPWIAQFDVGLLPSYFAAESLPNVVIECQAQAKPVIATRVGGIPEMLEIDGRPCGLLVAINSTTGRADVAALADAMRLLMDAEETYQQLSAAASAAYVRYSPERCCDAYSTLFQAVAA